jgi:phage gpG-like protein
MSDSYVKIEMKEFDHLVKELGKKYYVDIGIFGGTHKNEKGNPIPLAGLGAVHEFGSKKINVPERSFIRVPLRTHAKEIEKAIVPLAKKAIETGDIKSIFEEIGRECEKVIDDAFETSGDGTWPPLAESTQRAMVAKGIKSRKTARGKRNLVERNLERMSEHKLLIDTGELRRSITSKVGVNE